MRPEWRVMASVCRCTLRETLRDRRAMLLLLIIAVTTGPVLLGVLSGIASGLEAQAEQRRLHVTGMEHAPELRNHLLRWGYELVDAPADVEARIARGEFEEAVLRVVAQPDPQLDSDATMRVELLYNSAGQRTSTSVASLRKALDRYASERLRASLAMRGIAVGDVAGLDLQERDQSPPHARSARLFAMLPYLLVMGLLYAALGPALDSTAGARERGSLDLERVTAARPGALTTGRWCASSLLSALVAALSVAGLLAAQALLGGDVLATMYRFGPVEAAMTLLLPLCALAAAALLLLGAASRTLREAQGRATLLLLASALAPLLIASGADAGEDWREALPLLAQHAAMNRMLSGVLPGVQELLTGAGASLLPVPLLLWWAQRRLCAPS